MKTSCKYIVSAVMLLIVTAILAVTVRFYDSKQLSSTLVTSIAQDQRGYIWIGTEYGLNKFDGVRYTHYFNDEEDTTSLVNNSVLKLYKSKEGKLWVLTKGGVQVYLPKGDCFAKVSFTSDMGQVYVKGIAEDKDGKILLLSSEKGIFLLDAEHLQGIPMASQSKQLQGMKVDKLFVDGRNRIWITSQEGVCMFDGEKCKRYFTAETQYSQRIIAIIDDSKGEIYAFSHRCAYRFDEKTRAFSPAFDISVGLASMSIYKNTKGELVLTADQNGIYKVDLTHKTLLPQRFENDEMEDWSQQRITAYFEDVDHQTWIGCTQKGAFAFRNDEYPFHYMSLSNHETIGCLFADHKGQVFVGKGFDGLQKVGQDGFEGRSMLAGKKVISVCEQREDSWLVGVFDGGMYILNPKTGASSKIESTSYARVKSIVKDQQGNIYYVQFMKGIKSLDASGALEHRLCQGKMKLSSDFVNVLFADSKNRIWIGSYYGFDVYDASRDKMIEIPMDSVMRHATVYSIDETKDGKVWLGTNRGLFAYQAKDKSWQRYTIDNGLPNNNVCQVVDSKDGHLWISTYHGLARLNLASGDWQIFYYGNGLQYTNYGRGIGCRAPNGTIYWGNDNGFTYFKPKDIVNKNFLRGITLTGVLLADRQLSARDKSGGSQVMDAAVEDANQLTFSYDNNTFTLQFSTMDYRDLENVEYQYRFEDEKKGIWHSSQKGNSYIMFTHLSWETHHLQVRAIDNGAMSGVKKLTIHILPPWYASWWAYLLYLLIAAAVGCLVWRNYRNRRMALDNEMKIRLYVDISHEFRSPLTLIKSPLDTMLKRNYDAETMRGLRNIKRNTDRLLSLVNQILSIRKIEKGLMMLHFAEVNMVEFVENVLNNYEYDAEKRGVDLKFVHSAEVIKAWLDCGQFDKVVSNLVSNAFKYVGKDGEIAVSLQTQVAADNRSYVILKVQDSGPGIDEAQINKIFERFYQTSSSEVGQLGFGIGLNLTRKLVGLHRGTIEVHNRKDTHGAEFLVAIPMDNQGLSDKEMVDESFFQQVMENPSETKQEEVLLDQPAATATKHKTTYRVVVVDDDEQMLKFLQEELSVIYHVKAFNNGTDALEHIVENQPDLVVTDVKMPGMDGFTLLKRIKGNTKTSHVPVVLLTSEVEHRSKMTGFEQGADAYVDKPFDMDELEARVASLIANRIRVKGKFTGVQEQKDAIADIEMKGNNEQLMERIVKVTKERLTDPDFNVEALAADVGISRVQLHRKVKEMMGITVGDFIRNLRLQQAARLLEQGDLNISQITYAVGLTNPTHFSAAFKKYFGVTPKLYMQKHAENQGKEE